MIIHTTMIPGFESVIDTPYFYAVQIPVSGALVYMTRETMSQHKMRGRTTLLVRPRSFGRTDVRQYAVLSVILGIVSNGELLRLNNLAFVNMRDCGYRWCIARGFDKKCDFDAPSCLDDPTTHYNILVTATYRSGFYLLLQVRMCAVVRRLTAGRFCACI